ncbi:MAG: serine kinase [Pseudorhodoplanes sp.]|nr:serine kinase [Pseudorhodoplanes sp.]
MAQAATIHASAVLVGSRAVLIRGPSGSGKSRLALALLDLAAGGRVPFARLVGDDRVHVEAAGQRLLVRPAVALRGLLEIRGYGLCALPFEPAAVVGLIVDLAAPDALRLPESDQRSAALAGIELARLAVAPAIDPVPLVLAALYRPLGGDPTEPGPMPAPAQAGR